MKRLYAFLCLLSILLISCSKNNDATIACFTDGYNGTYVGTVTINQVASPATIKLTKKDCYEAQIESAANIGDKNISAIVPNGQNGYIGKLVVDGSVISFVLNANTITIIANTKYSFVGTK